MKNKIFLSLVIFLFVSLLAHSQNVKTLKGHTGNVNAIQFFPDGKSFASGGSDDDIFIWSYGTFEKISTIKSDLSDILDIKIMDNGNWIVTGNKAYNRTILPKSKLSEEDRTIGLWDVKNKTQSYPFNLYSDMSSIDVSPDGDNLVYVFNNGWAHYYGNKVTFTLNIKIYQYNITTGETNECVFDYGEHLYDTEPKESKIDHEYTEVKYVKYIDNNNLVILFSNDILIIDINKKTIKKKIFQSDKYCYTPFMSLSPNKKLLALSNCSNNSWISIWDLELGKSIKTLKGHDKDVLCAAFSPDGNYLASGSEDNTIRLWDVNTGKLIKILKGHENNVNTVCFSPDGKALISGSDDETIKAWSVTEYLPELKIFSINYDINIGVKKKNEDEYLKEYDETIANYFKPKGEFETTEDYNKRVETGKELESQLKEKYRLRYEELKASKESELQYESKQKQEADKQKSAETQDKIDKSTKDTVVNITRISSYNADNQTFTITTKGNSVDVIIPISDAPGFKENWQKATVKCKKRLMNDLISWVYFDFVIVHPISKVEYPAIKKEK